MPMNTSLIGRSYPETRYRVTAEATQKYARAINEDNPLFYEDGTLMYFGDAKQALEDALSALKRL